MSLRQKLVFVLGATLLAAACSSPTGPSTCGDDPVTIGSSHCVVR